jgi:hypothetical protein
VDHNVAVTVGSGTRGNHSRWHRRAVLAAALVTTLVAIFLGATLLREASETARTTPRYDPPVLAGQNVPGPCATGGFYAHDGDTIVLTLAAHCVLAIPGTPLRELDGRLVGTFGKSAEADACPAGRTCFAADIIALELAPDHVPWGHLNLVDMGAGGYRTITAATPALSCADVHVGDRVEVDGRERFRSGKVIEVGPYAHATDTIFPCMVVTDIKGGPGDSGSAVLVNGLPAGTTSRVISEFLAFTPLAEGLTAIGLSLCVTPDCDVTPTPAPASQALGRPIGSPARTAPQPPGSTSAR